MHRKDQELITRGEIARHLMKVHPSREVGRGCLICGAWWWAIELGSVDAKQIEDILAATAPLIEVLDF